MKYIFALFAIVFFLFQCNKEREQPAPENSQNTATTPVPASALQWKVDSLTGELCFRVYNSEKALETLKKKRWPNVEQPTPIPMRATDPMYYKSHNPPE